MDWHEHLIENHRDSKRDKEEKLVLNLTSRAYFRQHNQMHQQLNLALLKQMDLYQSGNHL